MPSCPLCGAAYDPEQGDMCADCREQVEFDESLPWYRAATKSPSGEGRG